MDAGLIRALRDIAVELKTIRKILQAEKAPDKIVIDNNGITVRKDSMPDMETYFERLEDDSK